MAHDNGSQPSTAEERTPLLPHDKLKKTGGNSILPLLLLSGFLISLTFGITQVPILYVFRVMTCDAYYEKHTPDPSAIDRCAKHEIEAGASRAFAVLSASTSIFGLVNLMVAGWTIKRLGVKRALIIQVFWPAVRVFFQIIGIMKGSNTGIAIVQASQILTVFGGPNGYVLCLNSFVADVVGHEARTGALGRLQGLMFIGAAIGFLIGGVVGDAFGVIEPFHMAFISFLVCCVYVALALPATAPPETRNDTPSRQVLGISRFFGPLRIFTPQKWVLPDGRTTTQFGALTLGIGVFLGILATGYITILLQQYATSRFHFGTKDNGYLIFIYFSLRGAFLSLLFPRIIARGRKWLKSRVAKQQDKSQNDESQDNEPLISDQPIAPNEVEVMDPMENEEPPNPAPQDEQETFAFDLFYARFSVLLDAILTGAAMFVTQGWQMYIVALILPFSAGTGAASKGTILQMLPSSDRTDALSGITLVENIARLSTTAVFGLVFSALANVGKSHLVFICNASVALLAFIILCLSRFPPQGSKRAEHV
ncbi:MFS general substrate transporter [Ophiobolus disseminans]|uniref:MFS general substrate transporter n=1 Tax=Ophiobolus disseminans TaxID=1469910 RepID=A0A6A6ZE96_9PLEO|nr:MFS general substrate transporter [Ophiobolus disseminans]